MEGRLIEVTQILLKSEKEITVKEISDQMGVSGRTIRNYLDKIEERLLAYDLQLDKVPGVGIVLKGNQESKNRLSKSLSASFYNEDISPLHRQESIILTIMLNSNRYNIDRLAYRLHVSPSTIYKDIVKIEKWLNDRNLQLVTTNGKFSVDGDEKHIRKVLSQFILENQTNLVDVHDIDNMSISTQSWVENNFGFSYKSIERFLLNLQDKLEMKFSSDVFVSLILHISVSLYRVQQGKTVELPENIRNFIDASTDYKIVNECADNFYKQYGLSIDEHEVSYITLHISTNRNYSSMDTYRELFGNDNHVDMAMTVAKEIASISSKALDLDLNNDDIFLNSLVLHLIPTITRLKSDLSLKNPILHEIKSEYTETFGLAWMSSLIVEKNLGVRIPESEIGYIAIHIGAAVERNKTKIKARIVSDSGYGTKQFIMQGLAREFKELDFVDEHEVDLIITTMNESGDGVISISPLLVESDIESIRGFIDGFYIHDISHRELEKKLYFNDSSKSKVEVLSKMCQYVEEMGFVTSNYVDTVFERERVLSTEVGNLVAIPHGASSEVKKSCVVLMTLKEHIEWDSNEVKFVILVSLSEEDLDLGKVIFSNLSNHMTDHSFYKNLEASESSCQKEFDDLVKINKGD